MHALPTALAPLAVTFALALAACGGAASPPAIAPGFVNAVAPLPEPPAPPARWMRAAVVRAAAVAPAAPAAAPQHVVFVRFRSKLPLDRVMAIARERAPLFRGLDGLTQKYYMHDPATNTFAGIYLWASKEAMTSYRQSEFAAGTAAAYQAEGKPVVEVYDVKEILRPGE